METSSGPSNTGNPGDVKILQSKQLPANKDKKKQQKQLILLAILVCVFAYFIYANILAPKQKAASVAAKDKSVQAAHPTSYPSSLAVISDSDRESVSGLDALLKDDEWDRNPFSLGGEDEDMEVSNSALRLDGIVFDGNDSYAIISKKIVKKGDRLADKVVKEIRENEVLLKTDDGQFIELKT
jgi:hypothetical protein